MLFVTAPEVASRPQTGGVLLADHELSADPLHVTVVGPHGNDVAQALLLEARRDPDGGKRVELWDPGGRPAASLRRRLSASRPTGGLSVRRRALLAARVRRKRAASTRLSALARGGNDTSWAPDLGSSR